MLNIIDAEYHKEAFHAKYCYAEFHYAECHSAGNPDPCLIFHKFNEEIKPLV